MESNSEVESADERAVLAAAIERRRQIRAKLKDTAEALDRGQALADGAVAELGRLNAVVETQKTQRTKSLIQRIISGFGDGDSASIDDQATRLERIAAQDQADIARAALEQLAAQHQTLIAELSKATGTVEAAANAVIRADARELYQQYLAARRSSRELWRRLMSLRLMQDVWRSSGYYFPVLSDVEWDAIDYGPRQTPGAEALGIPITMLGLSLTEAMPDNRSERARIDNFSIDWQQRLDALIADAAQD
jgi:hypothetical protein